jgi:hypothetical protein
LFGVPASNVNNDMKIVEITHELPPDVAAAFEQLSQEQRGAPEIAMVRVQFAMGGGVLNPVVEHVGDIINRMTQVKVIDWGLDAAAEKIAKTYRWMTHGYGFEREMEENIRSNAEDKGVPVEQFRQTIDQALAVYAQAHSQLPVYNGAQYSAREASVCLGQKQWNGAVQRLSELWLMSRAPTWADRALAYRKDENGQLLQYPYPRKYLQMNQSGTAGAMARSPSPSISTASTTGKNSPATPNSYID